MGKGTGEPNQAGKEAKNAMKSADSQESGFSLMLGELSGIYRGSLHIVFQHREAKIWSPRLVPH